MNFKSKVLCTLIILVLLNINFGVDTAPTDSGKIIKLLSMRVSELTEQHLIMEIKATGPVEYRNMVLKKISEEIIIFYADMHNTHSCIDGGGLVKIIPSISSNLSIDVPVIKINISQFRLAPTPISRVVFYLKKPIKPEVTAKGNSLLFTFPIASTHSEAERQSSVSQKPQPESPAEVTPVTPEQKRQPEPPSTEIKQTEVKERPTEAKEEPAMITQVEPVFEAKVTKLRIISDKQLNFKQVVSEKEPPSADIEAILELDFVNATSNLPREIPIQGESVIRKITLETERGTPPSCKIIIHLAKRVFYDISNKDGELQVSFENPILDQIVTIKYYNETLRNLLFTLFRDYNANIIVDKASGVDDSQEVTFNLENVPLKVALDEILGSLGYTYEEASGGILRIVPVEPQPLGISEGEVVKPKKLETKSFTLQYALVSKLKEVFESLISEDGKIIEDERTKSIIIIDTPENLAALGDTLDKIVSELDKEVPEEEKSSEQPEEKIELTTSVIKLNYANPEELEKILTPLLKSKEGKIEPLGTSGGTSGAGGASSGASGAGGAALGASVGQGGYLIVTDTPEGISQIEREIAKLDLPTPQVEIQVYIIESTLSDETELGVDWTRIRDKKTDISANALSSTGMLELNYGNIPAEQFTAVLTALSTRSDTKVLSCPRITVMENNQAIFHSGDQIGFSTMTVFQDGTRTVETDFQDVGTELTAKPQVKSDNIISLLIHVRVREIGEVAPTGEPTISDRSAQTQLLVRNGDTAIIGGLTKDIIIESVRKVPLLGNIPLLGRLFSHKRTIKRKTEITFFITPHIVKTEVENQSGIE